MNLKIAECARHRRMLQLRCSAGFETPFLQGGTFQFGPAASHILRIGGFPTRGVDWVRVPQKRASALGGAAPSCSARCFVVHGRRTMLSRELPNAASSFSPPRLWIARKRWGGQSLTIVSNIPGRFFYTLGSGRDPVPASFGPVSASILPRSARSLGYPRMNQSAYHKNVVLIAHHTGLQAGSS